MEKKFRKGLEKAGVKPEEIRLLLLNHGHFDHIGGAKTIYPAHGHPFPAEVIQQAIFAACPWGE